MLGRVFAARTVFDELPGVWLDRFGFGPGPDAARSGGLYSGMCAFNVMRRRYEISARRPGVLVCF